jgi:hypothetical protein
LGFAFTSTIKPPKQSFKTTFTQKKLKPINVTNNCPPASKIYLNSFKEGAKIQSKKTKHSAHSQN